MVGLSAQNRPGSLKLHIAKKLARHHYDCVEADELLNVAAATIMRSLMTFDPSRGVRFTTYCTGRAKGGMLDYIRDTDPVPRLSRQRMKVLDRSAQAFRKEHGRPPTRDEHRDATGLAEDRFKLHEGSRINPTASLFEQTTAGDGTPAYLVDGIVARPDDTSAAPFEAQEITRTYSHAFIVRTDDIHDSKAIVLAASGVPQYRQPHWDHNDALATDIEWEPWEDSPKIRTDFSVPENGGQPAVRPLQRPADFAYSATEYTESLFQDQHEPPRPYVNSAGSPF